jgi:hypothetical protein
MRKNWSQRFSHGRGSSRPSYVGALFLLAVVDDLLQLQVVHDDGESALVALDGGERRHQLIHHGTQLSDLLLRCRQLSGSGGHGDETGEGWVGISAAAVVMVVGSRYQDGGRL